MQGHKKNNIGRLFKCHWNRHHHAICFDGCICLVVGERTKRWGDSDDWNTIICIGPGSCPSVLTGPTMVGRTTNCVLDDSDIEWLDKGESK